MKPTKILSLILAALLLLPLFASCGESKENTDTPATTSNDMQSPGSEEETEPEPEETTPKPDLADDLTFGGADFTFGVVDNPNARNSIAIEDINGEALNDAQYTTVAETMQARDVKIGEYVLTNGYPAANALIPFITAGDDVIQVANVFCVDAPTLMMRGYVYDYSSVPHIDLSMPWWDASVNASMELTGIRYAAIGDLSVSLHDLTYVLLFSSQIITDNGLESPYSLVREGEWTMDKMKVMMETAMKDSNGNGTRDAGDVFGYLAATKMVLPSFWIGADEKSMEYDENGVPVLAMNDERFMSVFEKIFAMTYDNEAWFKVYEDLDVPTECRNMFSSNHSLFMDCSLFYVGMMREMETDFGIIPYPKFDETQADYRARVSYYMPPVIPITNVVLDMTGAVLEEANYRAMNNIKPAYYEISLKKYSRDPDSIAMLDLIFKNRVVDLGDTLFCSNIRDGFASSMFGNNSRDLASTLKKNEKVVNKTAEKMCQSLVIDKKG